MRHLWTSATTESTVTRDAGEPEWLDLPLQDFVIPLASDPLERPHGARVRSTLAAQSRWLLDEMDVGCALVPFVEYRDPMGITWFERTT